MKKILLLLFIASSLMVQAQKTIYDANVETRSVKGYKSIKVSHGIDLHLSYGEEAVAVSAKDLEYRDRIKTEVENGVLKIWYEWKEGKNILMANNKNLKAYVSYKNLETLSASGGSDIFVDGSIDVNNLSISVSGGSDFKGKVSVNDLKINLSGGSDAVISGKATNVSISASGGSDLKGYDLVSDVATISASGGSDVEITVNKDLDARASGGSDIYYKGGASVKETRSSGASSVKKRSS
jgi:hypothetical protein